MLPFLKLVAHSIQDILDSLIFLSSLAYYSSACLRVQVISRGHTLPICRSRRAVGQGNLLCGARTASGQEVVHTSDGTTMPIRYFKEATSESAVVFNDLFFVNVLLFHTTVPHLGAWPFGFDRLSVSVSDIQGLRN